MKSKNKLIYVITIVYILLLVTNSVLADLNTPVTMDFKGADLRDVLRSLAQIAEVNLITHQSVQGEVTLTLTEVPFKNVIELIILINDLEYRWVENTLLIAAPEKIQQKFSEIEMRLFKIQYAELDKTKEMLEKLMEGSTIAIDSRTRTLAIAAEKSQMTQIEKIISGVDIPIPQIFLEIKVEEISTSDLDKVGVPQGDNAKLKFLFDAKGLVTDIGFELPGIVEALEKEGLAKTLANPSLVVLDGKTAKLLIGDKIPVEAEEVVDGQRQTVIKYIEAGIKLEFTPRISDDGYITLNVKPQVSSIGEYLTKGYPLIKSREIETEVRIYNGETFVIGGLIRQEDRKSVEKVPLLGEIPILGALFSYEEHNLQSTEIVIFITPRIINPNMQKGRLNSEPLIDKQNVDLIPEMLVENTELSSTSSEIPSISQLEDGEGFEVNLEELVKNIQSLLDEKMKEN
ncbi:MAG: hypothetical protein KAX49_12495 [Halanaerobiales bacterium]|nr:hypothetical protein [Halanaerobiales bacterium]